MSGLIVPCPHCSVPAQLDPAQLPDGPAAYPCPQCNQQVVVDKRELLGRQAGAGPAPAAPSAQPAVPEPPAAPAADRRFPKLPANATLPSGIVVGDDEALIVEVQSTLAALGSEIERVASPEAARSLIINEQPGLCVYAGHEIPPPPCSALRPLTGLPPDCRRAVYLVLIGDGLKTLNGNSAFLYQVNLVVGREDLAQLGAVLHTGVEYHQRLYRPFLQASTLR